MTKKKISKFVLWVVIIAAIIYINHLTYQPQRWLKLPDIIYFIQ